MILIQTKPADSRNGTSNRLMALKLYTSSLTHLLDISGKIRLGELM
jgi:hypothetical protein